MRIGRKTKPGLVVGAVTAVVMTGTGWAIASDGEDPDDQPIDGTALEQAEEAALAETGGGSVVGTEVDADADGYYEVEVMLEDGSEVEVNLDRDFQVLGTENESDEDESSEADDDD